MKAWDVIVAGGGVIGLAVAWFLQKSGCHVLLVERGEPAREASFAAAGMIAVCDPHNDERLRPLAETSVSLYPGFVHDLQDESQLPVGMRSEGVIAFLDPQLHSQLLPAIKPLNSEELARLEPGLSTRSGAFYLPESWVDPRALCDALIAAFRHRGGTLASGSPVLAIESDGSRVTGVRTEQTRYAAGTVVNCCGAWAGQLGPDPFPTRPVKGQMLSVVPVAEAGSHKPLLRHVIRGSEIYLVPRNDGRVVIGSTLEEAGFDKQIDPATIRSLQQKAAAILPEIGRTRIHEVWAGLRPGTPDGLPLLGPTSLRGCFVAAGHYRDGIMLAPGTAAVMTALIAGQQSTVDLRAFSPARFQR